MIRPDAGKRTRICHATAIPFQLTTRRPDPSPSIRRALNNIQPDSDPLGISCQLCYKPAEEWSGTRESRAHDDGATFNIIPHAIDPGGSLLQPGRDRLSLRDHAESRRDKL